MASSSTRRRCSPKWRARRKLTAPQIPKPTNGEPMPKPAPGADRVLQRLVEVGHSFAPRLVDGGTTSTHAKVRTPVAPREAHHRLSAIRPAGNHAQPVQATRSLALDDAVSRMSESHGRHGMTRGSRTAMGRGRLRPDWHPRPGRVQSPPRPGGSTSTDHPTTRRRCSASRPTRPRRRRPCCGFRSCRAESCGRCRRGT